jgi:hypothetical protein
LSAPDTDKNQIRASRLTTASPSVTIHVFQLAI